MRISMTTTKRKETLPKECSINTENKRSNNNKDQMVRGNISRNAVVARKQEEEETKN